MKRLFVGGTGLAALSTVISLLDRGFRFEEITFFEKRNHPGGNVWDFDRGKKYHRYGVHIFHTNSPEVIKFVSRFSSFYSISYNAYAVTENDICSFIPSSLFWVRLYLGEIELEEELLNRKIPVGNLPEPLKSFVYENWYAPYSKKVWGDYWDEEMVKTVASRVPFFTDWKRYHSYFDDKMVALPVDGYWKMIIRMIDYIRNYVPVVNIVYSEDALDHLNDIKNNPFIYTGDLDRLYQRVTGKEEHLPYIHLRIETREKLEGISSDPYVLRKLKEWSTLESIGFHLSSDREPFTRVIDHSRLNLDRVYTIEYPSQHPQENSFKAYPINKKTYREKAASMKNELECHGIILVGRLATYNYYNMDQVIAQGINIAKKLNELPVFTG
ncbi:similar to UDP-galactopyranose mutase [Rhodothermus phage RM378]|uniref:similar to UDP-galactopyranose mutase n=1 Tax=Rhodothermus phage RM378 TaxID=148943 RepID=UPI000018F67C|nr:similar to UDP-galactopyranose mutase [Rhodothermus phage RM378]